MLPLVSLTLQRDVAGDLRCTYDISVVITYWRNGQRDRNERAVLTLPDGFKMGNPLTLAQPSDKTCFFIDTIIGEKHCDRLTYSFLCLIAEKTLRARIPALDYAVETLCNNGVIRALDDGSQVLLEISYQVFHFKPCPVFATDQYYQKP